MNAAELRKSLEYFSDNEEIAGQFVARELDVRAVTIRNWLQVRSPMSTPAAVAIKLLCELQEPLKPSMTREPLRPPITREELDEAIDEPCCSRFTKL